ncbi:MAG TPA: substrate-binding domain-containing protein, partial [Polyangiaceae bacterium]|nr:substrate-binding domain-containing protein [Polyangiaceae bacterium]
MPGRKTLALLVNDVFGAYQAAFRSAIERAAARSGCGLLVFSGRSLGHPDPYERAQNRLYDWVSPRVADGAIVLSGTVAHFADRTAMAGLCARLGAMPVVSIALEIPGVPSILMENRSALSESVSHVALHHRRRRIAYIGGPLGNEEARDRLAGYHDALRACNLPLDEQLVTAGLFTLPSGAACMEQMVGRDVPFDAVVAANDQMAIGAMDVLRALGVRVPEEVVVVGFDDTPIAQFAARALTTIAQPIERMGEAGVEAVLAQIAGRSAAAKMSFDGHLVLRESCGCSYKNTRSAISLRPPQSTAADYARQNRERLIDEASPSSEPTAHRWRARWAPRLIDALTAELAGDTGAFLIEIEQTGDEARGEHASLEEIGRFVASLQALFDDAGYRGAREFELEQLWISARAIVSTAISRAQARAALIQVEGSVDLRYVTQRISIAFDTASLAAELERSLPQLGVDWAYVALRSKDAGGSLRPLVALEGGARASWPAQPYPAAQLFPGGGGGVPRCVLLWAITFEHE